MHSLIAIFFFFLTSKLIVFKRERVRERRKEKKIKKKKKKKRDKTERSYSQRRAIQRLCSPASQQVFPGNLQRKNIFLYRELVIERWGKNWQITPIPRQYSQLAMILNYILNQHLEFKRLDLPLRTRASKDRFSCFDVDDVVFFHVESTQNSTLRGSISISTLKDSISISTLKDSISMF